MNSKEHGCEQIGDNHVYLEHDKDWILTVYHFDTDARSNIYIDYCPFCGKKLE